MNCCIIRKVPFKNGNRITWGLVLSEREGLSLLVLQRTEKDKEHSLMVGIEGANGIFESVEMNRFPLVHGDLEKLGEKLQALGEELDENSFNRFLRTDEGDWWKNL